MKRKLALQFSLFSLLGVLCIEQVYADGTKQLRPDSTGRSSIQLYDQSGGNAALPHRKFATYEADSNQRLCVTIDDFNDEVVFLGFRASADLTATDTLYYRIKDWEGNIVLGPSILPRNGTGYINSYSQAQKGPHSPSLFPNPGGYAPIVFNPAKNGHYYVEFNLRYPDSIPPKAEKKRIILEYFDISVLNKVNNKLAEGRVWSRAWDFNTNGASNPFNAKLYVYADDGIITEVNFNGMQPHGFVVSCNFTGTQRTGDVFEDRRSTPGDSTYPQYKIFLTFPDTLVFPAGKLGTLAQVDNLKCFEEGGYCINLITTSGGQVEALIDLNGIPGFQPGSEDIFLDTIVATAGEYCIQWDGKDGLGAPLSYGSEHKAYVSFKRGLTHMPLYDVEGHPNGYMVNMVVPEKRLLQLYWDDSKIPGGSQNLDGCWPDTLNKRGCHGWKRTNADSISRSLPPVNPPGFGDNKTVNTWWYATADLDTIPIKVPTPFPVIIASDRKYGDVDTAVICLRSKLVLDPKFTEDTVNYSFLWYTETGDVVSTERNPVFYNIKDNSKYYVKITDNETNCISIDTYLFRVKELFVPNIITPNEDAKNDFFIIKDLIPNSKLEVFNRWGKLIYENDNYDNSWAGNDLNDGIYYYRLETPGSCGTFKGWVHIVR